MTSASGNWAAKNGFVTCSILYLTPEEKAKFQKICHQDNRSMSRAMRHIVLAYIRTKERASAAREEDGEGLLVP